jgi:hypothetical protein
MKTYSVFQFDKLSFPARPECFTKCNVVKCIEGLILLVSAPFDTPLRGTQGERKYNFLYYILLLFSTPLDCMEPEQHKGPMDSVWFYDKSHAFAQANQLHQEQKWKEATREYRDVLAQLKPTDNVRSPDEMHHILDSATEYHIHKAQLNLAACLMAQRQETEHWASFDALLDIPKPKHISSDLIHHHKKPLKDQIVLVRTDQIGLGDIFCFLSAAHELKKRTQCHILLSIPKVLKETLTSTAREYGFTLLFSGINSSQLVPYETHLIALLGHLHLKPSQMNPEKVVFTAPERAMNVVLEQVLPVLEQGNILVVADRGEVGRQATFIGGKQLPYDTMHHGRHLDSNPFTILLNNHSNIVLMDSSSENNRIMVDDKQKDRYLTIAPEQQPFDVIIALGRIMSKKKNIIAFGSDMGQSNVFARSLDHDAQNRMAFIIPNPQENDMRMEGEGSKYKHMLSHCWVYKCQIPLDQTQVIEQAYNDMLEYTREKK